MRIKGLGVCRRSFLRLRLRIRLRKVTRLAEIVGDVVEFPGICIRIGRGSVHNPGEPERGRAGHPAIVIDAAVGDDLEVLRGVARGGEQTFEYFRFAADIELGTRVCPRVIARDVLVAPRIGDTTTWSA